MAKLKFIGQKQKNFTPDKALPIGDKPPGLRFKSVRKIKFPQPKLPVFHGPGVK